MKIHGQTGTRLWNIWREMRHRCNSQSDKDYFYYGLRGIRVCPEWDASFTVFRDWALSHGYAEDLTLDRIDHRGDYSPSNCRWVTRAENSTEVGRRRKGVTKEIQVTRRLWRKIYDDLGPDFPDKARAVLTEAMETTDYPILPIPVKGKPPAEGTTDGEG